MPLDVKQFMTGAPVAIEPDMPAVAALDLMIEHSIRHLPVLDAERRVCGIVSFDDLRAALPFAVSLASPPGVEERARMMDVSVRDAMTDTPVTIEADAALEQAVARMLDGRFGCLPVVDAERRLDGILTETDLLQALATVLWSTPDQGGDAEDDPGQGDGRA